MRPFHPVMLCAFLVLAVAGVPQQVRAHGSAHAAVERLTREIDDAPERADLFLQRGELYRIHREFSRARADFDHAQTLAPELRALEICRAALALDEGKASESRAILDGFLADHPTHIEALRLRAEAHHRLGEIEASLVDLGVAFELDPNPTPDHVLAHAARVASLGPTQLQRAIAVIDAGIHRLGPVPTLDLAAVDYESRLGDVDAALLRLDRVASGLPRGESVLLRRGEVLLAAGRNLEAEAAFTEALELIESVPPNRRNPTLLDLQSRLRNLLAASLSPSPLSPSPQGESDHASP